MSGPRVQAAIGGIYPRSHALVQATRDHDRGRIDNDELKEQLGRDRQALLRFQEEARLDLLVDGMLNWQDLFRPFVEATRGLATGSLVRYFNTNTFYRQPVCESHTLELDCAALEPYFTRFAADQARWKATLPSPYAFVESADPAGGKRADELVDLLVRCVHWLVGRGWNVIQLEEPWLAYHSHELTSWDLTRFTEWCGRLVRQSAEWNGGVEVGIHFPFGDAAPLLGALDEVPAHFIGVDFYHTDVEALRDHDWRARTLVAGCLDGRNSRVEDEEALLTFVERVFLTLDPAALCLTNNVDLQFVPEPIARRKVELLGRVKHRFADNLEPRT